MAATDIPHALRPDRDTTFDARIDSYDVPHPAATEPLSVNDSNETKSSRWGLSIGSRELTPEPLDWRPPPTAWQRIKRAAFVPAAAAAVVFIAIVLVSIATVWFKPHDLSEPAKSEAAELEFTLSDEAGAGVHSSSDENASGFQTNSDDLFVHVVGEVAKPGVYELPPRSRVSDAIEAAGGATDVAELSSINLARVLVDGEQIAVFDAAAVAAGTVAPVPSSGSAAQPSGLLNLNSADAASLETLPRVGPALAQRIIDWREANGGFASTEQLLSVSGIGQKTFEQLKDQVTV